MMSLIGLLCNTFTVLFYLHFLLYLNEDNQYEAILCGKILPQNPATFYC